MEISDQPRSPVLFIVVIYGMRHAGMLLNHLYSVTQSHPESRAVVYWQDVPATFIEALSSAFPAAKFVQTAFSFLSDPIKRIASKVLAWYAAVEDHSGSGNVCLADADTLVLRGIDHFFEEAPDADVIFTHDTDPLHNRDRAQINSGVILFRGGSRATEFFRLWRDETLRILETPELYRRANDHSLPYAAADQMALHHLLNYEPGKAAYQLNSHPAPICVIAVPASQLNETNSRPIAADTHIVHYKGGWQHILLGGRPFSVFRPRVESWEMFVRYLSTFHGALRHLNAAAGTTYTAEDLGIVIPWHYRASDQAFLPGRYLLWRGKEAAKRAWQLCTGTLPANG